MPDPKSPKKETSKSKDKTKEKEKEKEKDKEKSVLKDKEKKKKGDKEVSISEVASIRGGDLKAPGKLQLEEIQSKADDFMSMVNTPFNAPKEKSCIHHQQKMTFFCDSCQEPACQRCTVIGPHNSQLHRLQDIDIAFQTQARALHTIINNSLITKRDQLAAQNYRIEYRVSEIKQVKTYVERDVRAEYEGMLENLRAAEGTKTVVLRHDLENIQRDIDRINEVLEVFTETTKKDANQLDFLAKYSNLKDSVQYAMSKDFKRSVDVVANDLPNELPKKRAVLEKAIHFDRVSAFKDKVILELAMRSSEQVQGIREEFERRTSEEIQEWSKLTDTFNQELKKFQVICFYCGCDLTDTSVNTVCKANKKSSYPINFGYTVEMPDPDWHKTKRHFFAKPRSDIALKGPSKDPEDEALSRSPLRDKKARVPYQAFLEVIVHKILRGCEENETSVEKIVRNYDANQTGKITFTALAFLLNKYCSLDNVEVERLKEVLDPLGKNTVQISDFLQIVHDIQNYEHAY